MLRVNQYIWVSAVQWDKMTCASCGPTPLCRISALDPPIFFFSLPAQTMAQYNVFSGIFTDEQAQRFLKIMSTACDNTFCDLFAHSMPHQPARFRECLDRVGQWERSVVEDEVQNLSREYPDLQDIFKHVFVQFSKSVKGTDPSMKMLVRLPKLSECLHAFFVHCAKHRSIQDARYFQQYGALDQRIVCMDALRDALYDFVGDDFIKLEDASVISKAASSIHKIGDPEQIKYGGAMMQHPVAVPSEMLSDNKSVLLPFANPIPESSHVDENTSVPISQCTEAHRATEANQTNESDESSRRDEREIRRGDDDSDVGSQTRREDGPPSNYRNTQSREEKNQQHDDSDVRHQSRRDKRSDERRQYDNSDIGTHPRRDERRDKRQPRYANSNIGSQTRHNENRRCDNDDSDIGNQTRSEEHSRRDNEY